jgi:hypothetical protein
MLPGEKEIRNPRRRVVRRIARSTASESQDLAVENQKSIHGLVKRKRCLLKQIGGRVATREEVSEIARPVKKRIRLVRETIGSQ